MLEEEFKFRRTSGGCVGAWVRGCGCPISRQQPEHKQEEEARERESSHIRGASSSCVRSRASVGVLMSGLLMSGLYSHADTSTYTHRHTHILTDKLRIRVADTYTYMCVCVCV